MDNSTNESTIPEYENPPVVEIILGVQFDRLPSFQSAHLGAFWKKLGSEWPMVSDAPPLQMQFERFTDSARWAAVGAQFKLTQEPSLRLQIKNKKGDRMIQVQNGRFHLNWLGEEGGADPLYQRICDEFRSALDEFVGYVGQEGLGEFHPNQWEITYLNHIPKGTVWHSPKDWHFFRPLGCISGIDSLFQNESFDGEWHFVIPEQKGRLHVQWLHALRTEEEEEHEIVRLTLTARGPTLKEDDAIRSVLDGLGLGHRTIVQSFPKLMSEEANKYWGLKNA